YRQVTTVIVAKKRLRAIARPFYRAPQTARRPSHQRELRIGVIARAKISTHVLRNHAYLVRLQAKHVSEIQFCANDPAAARIKRDLAGFWCRSGQRRSDFHWHAGNTRYFCLDANHVSRPLKHLISSSPITDVRV